MTRNIIKWKFKRVACIDMKIETNRAMVSCWHAILTAAKNSNDWVFHNFHRLLDKLSRIEENVIRFNQIARFQCDFFYISIDFNWNCIETSICVKDWATDGVIEYDVLWKINIIKVNLLSCKFLMVLIVSRRFPAWHGTWTPPQIISIQIHKT